MGQTITCEKEAGPSLVTSYAMEPPEVVAAKEGVDLKEGLSESEAARRLQEVGPNSIQVREVTPWMLVQRQFQSGLTLLLIGAALLSLALGNTSEALIILALVILNSTLGFWQEYRATRALEELRKLVQVQARVRREGRERSIPSEQVVPGDLVLVQAGDIVPADLRLIESEALAVNEAPLTGESMPVQKTSAPLPEVSGRPTRLENILFAGTTVISGLGMGVVVATGNRTYFGQTASLLRGLEQPGPFQRQLNRFANLLLFIGLGALAIIIGINVLLGRGILSSFLFGLALIVGIVPEALPAVTAITLSLGAASLARHNVIVKRLGALQDLSSVTVLCTDKTGTLTGGTMRVETIWGAADLLSEAVLATTYPERGVNAIHDAIIDYAIQQGALKENAPPAPVLKRLPFDPQRKRSSSVVQRDSDVELIVLGAPPSVMAICTDYRAVGSQERAQTHFREMAEQALRVVAVAKRKLPRRQDYSLADENNLSFWGLIGMGDPIRPGVPEAIERARRLDVSVKILTGDNVLTARAVARRIGLVADGAVTVTGEELRRGNLPLEQLCATQIFAELQPQDKYRIVQALEEAGEAVAVTGDGVNDAPALRAATVGVAMASGTAVAKEAGDLILVGDDFASLVAGIGKGREILASLSKYLLYTMPGNYSILITMVFSSLILPFLPLDPAQVLLLATVTDLPMLAISTDIVDPEELAKPERLDVRRLISLAGILGVLGAAFNLGLVWFLRRADPAQFRTALTYELALTTFFLAPVVRSRRPLWRERSMSPPLWAALSAAMAFFVLLVSVPNPLARLFQFVALPAPLNLGLVGYSALYALMAEAADQAYYRLGQAAEPQRKKCG